jgi:hypothetical protein
MMYSKRLILAAAIAITAVLPFIQAKEGVAAQKSWTCNATIALQGGSLSYTVPNWPMSGPIASDREKRCKEHVKANWLDNGKIWSVLDIPSNQQNSYCQSGGNFRVDYGFDKRSKDWNFTQTSKPACACPGGMVFAK